MMRRTAEDSTAWTTYDAWYDGNRCPGSPRNPKRALKLARRIAGEDFAEVIEPGEVESLAIETLAACFEDFDPAQGDQDVSVEDRFLRLFKHSFRRRLRDLKRDRTNQERRKATLRYYRWKEGLSQRTEEDEVIAEWRRILCGRALRRLSRQAQDYVRYRLLEELTEGETAARMGVPRGRLRPYERGGIYRIFRKEIGAMVREMPAEDLDPMVYRMHIEHELDEDEIARLLCLPKAEVEGLVRGVTGRVVDRLFREDGWSGEAA